MIEQGIPDDYFILAEKFCQAIQLDINEEYYELEYGTNIPKKNQLDAYPVLDPSQLPLACLSIHLKNKIVIAIFFYQQLKPSIQCYSTKFGLTSPYTLNYYRNILDELWSNKNDLSERNKSFF